YGINDSTYLSTYEGELDAPLPLTNAAAAPAAVLRWLAAGLGPGTCGDSAHSLGRLQPDCLARMGARRDRQLTRRSRIGRMPGYHGQTAVSGRPAGRAAPDRRLPVRLQRRADDARL